MITSEVYKLLNGEERNLVVNVKEKRKTDFYGNNIVFCENSDGVEVVGKFPSKGSHARHEFAGYKTAEASGVRVPGVVGIVKDERGKLGVVTKRIIGKNLYSDHSEESKFILGATVNKLHNFRRIESTHLLKKEYPKYVEQINDWSRTELATILNAPGVYSILGNFSSDVEDEFQGTKLTFTHQDLHDDQVIVSCGLLYLIDFEDWRIGHPMEDVAIYLYHSLRTKRHPEDFRRFVDGYFAEDNFSDADKSCVSYFLLFYGMCMGNYFSQYRKYEIPFVAEYLHRSIDYVKGEELWKQ
jgi:hypothetical protein